MKRSFPTFISSRLEDLDAQAASLKGSADQLYAQSNHHKNLIGELKYRKAKSFLTVAGVAAAMTGDQLTEDQRDHLVEQEREIDAQIAEHEAKANDLLKRAKELTANYADAAQVILRCKEWLRGLNGSTKLSPARLPVIDKGDPLAQLALVRAEIAAKAEGIKQTRTMKLDVGEIRDRAHAYVQHLAASQLAKIGTARNTFTVNFIMPGYSAGSSSPELLPLLAAMFPDELEEYLVDCGDGSTEEGITEGERIRRLAALEKQLLAHERKECCLVETLLAQGTQAFHRRETNPMAVLQCEVLK